MTEDDKKYVDNMILNALTVSTDEYDGLQVINLDDINLCAVDYTIPDVVPDKETKTDEEILQEALANQDILKILLTPPEKLADVIDTITPPNSDVILEFADACVEDPNPVTYNISVKPGEPINNNTVIGSVVQEGIEKYIKSIFSSGTVKGINDNNDYFRLYPSRCSRHIILENTTRGNSSDYDFTNSLKELSDNFLKEGELFSLITNNMCESLLPYILSRRYRGTYSLKSTTVFPHPKFYVDSSDITVDNTYVKYIKNSAGWGLDKPDSSLFVLKTYNGSLPNGLGIYDSSIIKATETIKSKFIANMIGEGEDKVNSWQRRSKKKKKRKEVNKEINESINKTINTIKKSSDPKAELDKNSDRMLKAREEYINSLIELYNRKDKLPLCKYDETYADCQFLTYDSIDSDVLFLAKGINLNFSYATVGESDTYYNYYFSLLGNLSLYGSTDNEYILEYYNILTNIINKRLSIESHDIVSLIKSFMLLFNKNICNLFSLYTDDRKNTYDYLVKLFKLFEQEVKLHILNTLSAERMNVLGKLKNVDIDELIQNNVNNIKGPSDKYKLIFNYIKHLYETNHKQEDIEYDNTIALLTTMYMYISTYDVNMYRKWSPALYNNVYFKLVKEEAEILNNFWNKVIKKYKECVLSNCIDEIHLLGNKFDSLAEWPDATEITLNGHTYTHYLFTNIYKNPDDPDESSDENEDDKIDIGEYSFPDEITFPDIPDDIPIDPEWAEEQLENGESDVVLEKPKITFTDTAYWLKYFTLATLICLAPTFWNCGLDILPYIQNIPFPCIFIAFKCVNITMVHLVVVFGLAIRGMYVWPVILYLNTSDEPANLITPLITALDKVKDVIYKEIRHLEEAPKNIVDNYINKLSAEINDLKRENKKLEMYKDIVKCVNVPNFFLTQVQFAKIVDPSITPYQRLTRLDELAAKQRGY